MSSQIFNSFTEPFLGYTTIILWAGPTKKEVNEKKET